METEAHQKMLLDGPCTNPCNPTAWWYSILAQVNGDPLVVERSFLAMRHGSFMFMNRLAAKGLIENSTHCPFCEEEVVEDLEHYLLYCGAWETQRQLHLDMFHERIHLGDPDLCDEIMGFQPPLDEDELDWVPEMPWKRGRRLAHHWNTLLADLGDTEAATELAQAWNSEQHPVHALDIGSLWVDMLPESARPLLGMNGSGKGKEKKILWQLQRLPVLRFIADTIIPRWRLFKSKNIVSPRDPAAAVPRCSLMSLAPRLDSTNLASSSRAIPRCSLLSMAPRLGYQHLGAPMRVHHGSYPNPDPTNQSPSGIRSPLSSARSGAND